MRGSSGSKVSKRKPFATERNAPANLRAVSFETDKISSLRIDTQSSTVEDTELQQDN